MRHFKHFSNQGQEHLRGGRRFARGEGGPRFGRGGRLARFLEHGDLRLLVLHLIAEKPRHGYEIIKAIEDMTGGAYAPSPGVIYPTLTMLEELGQADITTEGSKKLFSITAEGQRILTENQAELEALRARIAATQPRENAAPVIRAMENLKTALRLKLSGREAAAEPLTRKIADLLDETTRKIEEL